jgi:hypothetical protein
MVNEGWIRKCLEESSPSLLGVLPRGTCLEGLKNATKHLNIAGVPTEIRIEYLPNTSLERHRYANLVGVWTK